MANYAQGTYVLKLSNQKVTTAWKVIYTLPAMLVFKNTAFANGSKSNVEKQATMTKQYLLLLGLTLSFTIVQGQVLQLGIGASINRTYFNKGQSTYDNYFFETKSKTSLGLSIPCYIKLSDQWTLRSGIGFQNKMYGFEQTNFDFPNVVDGTGSFSLEIKFTATEVPLIICFSPTDKDRKYKIEYKLGCILTRNAPTIIHGHVENFQYSGDDTVYYNFSHSLNWAKYYSPDIYAGISLIKTKETLRRKELTLSYQYSFTPSTKNDFATSLWTNSMSKEYKATLRPNMSYIALTYSLFPNWLNIIKNKDYITKTPKSKSA